MCGITGILQTNGAPADTDLLARMMKCMVHRGPDDSGSFHDGNYAVGFQRLAILDLTPTGHQPMHSPDGRYTIAFNGEVFNHVDLREELERDHGLKFVTRTDTEVVMHCLALWGPAALERFNGFFALALWDSQARALLLARDRVGKKPLYLAQVAGAWIFASEIKSLLQHPGLSRRMDAARLPAFLTNRFVPQDETLFEGVTCVLPGHHLTLTADGPGEQRCWWDMKFAVPENPPGEEVLRERLEELLTDATRLRMVADVPFGAFLSGGIDSSVIVALMAALHPMPVETFSVGFDTGFSEADHARKVAQLFKTKHHELTIGAGDMIRAVPATMFMRETPVSEPSDIPIYLLAQEARRHVTVVLSGEGSDEILAGYPKYGFEAGIGRWLKLLPPPLLRSAAAALPFKLRRAQLALEASAERDAAERHAMWFGGFPRRPRRRVLSGGPLAGIDAHAAARAMLAGRTWNSSMEQMLYLDMKAWLPANLLLRGDRMTMAHSLELRCPFLDYRLIEFCAREVPASMKVQQGKGKWLLRQLAARHLPADIINRPKWGFKVPIGEWFRGPLAQLLSAMLMSADSAVGQHLNGAEIARLVKEHHSGRCNHEKQLWILLQLELWHRMFIDQTLSPNDSLEDWGLQGSTAQNSRG